MSISNQDIEALRESIAAVLERECGSRKLHEFIDGKNFLDRDIWRQAKELGWFTLGLPEEYGGLDSGIAGLGLLHHELGRRLVPGSYMSTLTGSQWLMAHGTDEHKQNYLPRIAAGDLTIAIPAMPAGFDGGLVLKGGKLYGRAAAMLGPASAGLAIAPFRAEDGNEAWSLVVIDGETVCLTQDAIWDVTRQLCTLDCAGAAVAVASADAHRAHATLCLHLALAVACDSIGAANTILDQTIEYLKGRTQFDRPLASFQALKHRAANLKVALETARHLVAQAVDCAANNQPDARMWSMLAKSAATEAFARIAEDCLQLHGGVGFTWEFDCHLFLKRAKFNEALADSNETNLDLSAEALGSAMRAGHGALELPL